MATPPKRPKFIVDIATDEGCELPAEWTSELTPRRRATAERPLVCETCGAVWQIGMRPFWVVNPKRDPGSPEQYACDPCFNSDKWDRGREEMGWPPREPGVPYADTMARHDAELSARLSREPDPS